MKQLQVMIVFYSYIVDVGNVQDGLSNKPAKDCELVNKIMRSRMNLMQWKKCFIIIFLCAGTVFSSVSSSYATVSTVSILKRVLKVVFKLENKDFQVLFIQVDSVAKHGMSSQTCGLKRGDHYMIIAVGDDDRVQDIDLLVRDGNNKIVGRDADTKNVAIVHVRPRRTGKYKFIARGSRMSANDAFFAFIVARIN